MEGRGRPKTYGRKREAHVSNRIDGEIRDLVRERLATIKNATSRRADGVPNQAQLIEAAFVFALTAPTDELRDFIARADTEIQRFRQKVVLGGQPASEWASERREAHVEHKRKVDAAVRAELLAQFEARQAKAKTRRPKKAGGRA